MKNGFGSYPSPYAFAERFAQAGYACFLFDYRNYGASDGNKRQLINVKMQLHDWDTRTSKPPSAPTAIFTPNSTTSLQTCSPN